MDLYVPVCICDKIVVCIYQTSYFCCFKNVIVMVVVVAVAIVILHFNLWLLLLMSFKQKINLTDILLISTNTCTYPMYVSVVLLHLHHFHSQSEILNLIAFYYEFEFFPISFTKKIPTGCTILVLKVLALVRCGISMNSSESISFLERRKKQSGLLNISIGICKNE